MSYLEYPPPKPPKLYGVRVLLLILALYIITSIICLVLFLKGTQMTKQDFIEYHGTTAWVKFVSRYQNQIKLPTVCGRRKLNEQREEISNNPNIIVHFDFMMPTIKKMTNGKETILRKTKLNTKDLSPLFEEWLALDSRSDIESLEKSI